jgi:hypothetical protein
MKHFGALVGATILTAISTAAAACPDYNQYGAEYSYSGADLYSSRQFSVVAGGDNNLQSCGFKNSPGYVMTAPDFSFDLYKMGGYDIEISVLSNCDSMLLVNDPNANWYYDDDSNGMSDPKIRISGKDGYLDVWVGTYNGEYCDATLYLETF